MLYSDGLGKLTRCKISFTCIYSCLLASNLDLMHCHLKYPEIMCTRVEH